MPRVYNLKDIYLGAPSFSGHEVYLDAVYYPSDPSEKNFRVIYKKNKFGNANLSRMEVAFSQLARLFLDNGLTSFQKMVVNDANKVQGLIVEHLNYVIENKEGLKQPFYTLNAPRNGCDYTEKRVTSSNEIPFYFLDKLPQGFFNQLLAAEKNNKLNIDYASLASILATSYTLEEDDLHKGNFGFYLVKKKGKPRVIFFKIDHDLMFVDSIMSFTTRRFCHLFDGCDAFDITEEDLLKFPNLKYSANGYWPTKTSFFYKPWDNKDYRTYAEIQAFADLSHVEEFNKAKWRSFYKHILISKSQMEATLKACFDENNSSDRAHISLVIQAMLARQARLKAMLFSLKDFRDFILSQNGKERDLLCHEILNNLPEEERKSFENEIRQSLDYNHNLCCSGLFEDGDTPLHIAIKSGDYRYDETIGMYGQFINTKNSSGKTPLDIALQMAGQSKVHPADVRKDYRFIMKHLLANGANQTKQFEEFDKIENISSYQFHTPYLNKAIKAKTYHELKEVLRDIGEDHQYCLKFKKMLAVECISEFIKANQDNLSLRGILLKLKKEVDGKGTKSENAALMYIRQLRSRLWIVRQIRGLYGWSTTQGEIDYMIDKELARLDTKDLKRLSLFDSRDSSTLDNVFLDISLSKNKI
ncbi:Dot/Icm T4SS effector AnkK/LegA5 [Legionella pneumophila]|uniref:Dot/Icm T4SS effector AnkK/LegA5 n=1 Tax=Legionella pneumophila TaxID=446 RepID=UPI000777F15E|nr:Dot/Icm T4SS effector AnkK/LegA5 [Legionella pneumophila]HAT1802864.1 Dot/Icm T4SS effector AnkK/LegA5 [Legionella pneumophila]HAT8666548.1 Dot/Icm T4SS effector AnkK/LegA5 [Legionella pneumophila]HEL8459206.1 Dot/Icm T4SS effector AnkK/LegA5 [Legionella pneumophila]